MNLRAGTVKNLALAALVLAATGCGCGDSADPVVPPSTANTPSFSADEIRRLDQAVADQIQARNLPSVLVSVHAPGRGDYLALRGVANRETGIPRNAQDPFRIASVSKTFTATAIYILADQGKLSTSDLISKWFPTFPHASETTIDDLLRMRSGIPDYTDPPFLNHYFANPLLNFTAADAISTSAARVNDFTAPNQATEYRNINFVLLEQIVEMVSGKSAQAFMQETIFGPLGMTHSLYPTTETTLGGGLRGYSYDPETGQFLDKTVLNPIPAGGAGAVISNLADLHLYARALGQGSLLKPATQAQRLISFPFKGSPDFVRYGGGMEELGDFVGHNGTIFGFSTEMYYLPAQQATIVINVNRLDEDDKSQSADLFLAVSAILFPESSPWSAALTAGRAKP